MINPVELDATTALAVTRTRLAAERTLMSWIRTSFSMIGFGFTILKLFQYLKVNAITAHMVNGSSTKILGARVGVIVLSLQF